VLVADGFHVASVKLTMSSTAVPSLRQGTLAVSYETTVKQPPCPPGAPCRRAVPRHATIDLGCDQSVSPGANPAPSCDGLRGVTFIEQP
jgi:hypothetical protein